MQDKNSKSSSLYDRTLTGLDKVLQHALGHVEGFEKMVVNRAIQMLLPRVTRRIRIASEEDLHSELEYLHKLLDEILLTSPSPKTKSGLKTKRKLK